MSAKINTTFKASELIIEKTKTPRHKPTTEKELNELEFGTVFSDHMLVVDWTDTKGWETPRIVPYGPFFVDPAASVLHYALECFEGMKAYIDKDGHVRLFRPELNFERMSLSMQRLCMPPLPEAEALKCLQQLVLLDKDWIPRRPGYSLYIRPTAIGTNVRLGLHEPTSIRFYIVTSPVGPYYKTGFKPVSLYADSKNARAWPGGAARYKLGGNYAPTMLPGKEAQAKGYNQVLWLYDDAMTEVGAMNMFMFLKNEKGEKELVTAPVDQGCILPGITRRSILELSREWKEFVVSERTFAMKEFVTAHKEGRILEAFGSGTAAIVSPVKRIGYEGADYDIPCGDKGTAGPLTQRFVDVIMKIQYGEVEHKWSKKID